jgi:hypothetical protein
VNVDSYSAGFVAIVLLLDKFVVPPFFRRVVSLPTTKTHLPRARILADLLFSVNVLSWVRISYLVEDG